VGHHEITGITYVIYFGFLFFFTDHSCFTYSMSAIDLYCSIDKVKGVDGKDWVALVFDGKYLPHSEQVSCYCYLILIVTCRKLKLKNKK